VTVPHEQALDHDHIPGDVGPGGEWGQGEAVQMAKAVLLCVFARPEVVIERVGLAVDHQRFVQLGEQDNPAGRRPESRR
jgi:hypothetical protein